ncbi:class I SAM-dependent methyltransferase [Pseudorhodoplanes sp.]|uniref:SAM-dependent methyltransferase n=1 Tax=Pseudorhodoplanes sp. TaxID=1934341 RepID=UPI002D7FA7E3|nr:class I SAM-dependent methyltransferase [Pseudorhodoplanes sp.]
MPPVRTWTNPFAPIEGEVAMSEWERWETRFGAPGYLFGTEPNAFLKRHAHLLKPGQKALSIADGEGRNGVFLAECGLDVLAMDFSPTALVKAAALAKERGVTIRLERADLETWQWPVNAFDVVVAIFIQFCAPALRARVFDGIKRALKPGGLLLMEGYGLKQLEYKTGGPSQVENLYTRALLEEAFADFSSLEIEEYDAAIEEGDGHGGMSALVDFVGRK